MPRGLFNLTDVDFRLAPKLGKSDDKNYSGHDFLIAVFLKARYISLGMHSLRWIWDTTFTNPNDSVSQACVC